MTKGIAFTFLPFLLFTCCLQISSCNEYGNCSQCQFYKHEHFTPNHTKKLGPICGHRFSAEDRVRHFTYTLGICISAQQIPTEDKLKNAGAIQQQKDGKKTILLGKINMTDIITGTNWMMLEYYGGENYPNSCNKTQRSVKIMITCDPHAGQVKLEFLQEENGKTDDCYYLFTFQHAAVCEIEEKVDPSYLSAGMVFCIISYSVIFTYLVGGFLYQRFIRKAKGVNQIPNVAFWKELGSLMADGCDLVFRCGKGRGSTSDDGRGGQRDGLLENASDHIDVDDALLGM